MKKVIKIEQLSKTFLRRKIFPGILGAFKGLVAKKSEIKAIHEISLEVSQGERVAFIGPNGAGKSTTIKMMIGILYPSSGSIEILGLSPWKERRALGYKIGTVFGQRTQLWYHLPPKDTFDLLSKIYEIERSVYRKHLENLIEIFEIGHFLDQPVRQLSLGQRMRCEIVASLLHNPTILFLDEPTIGLDINAKLKIRNLLNKLSKEQGITLFLTSHDTADFEQVCERVVVLDKGQIIRDSSLKELKQRFVKKKVLRLTVEEQTLPLNLPGMTILENQDHQFVCELDRDHCSLEKVINAAMKVGTIKDVAIIEPSMEEIIREVYGNS